jgi:hypothetical protein
MEKLSNISEEHTASFFRAEVMRMEDKCYTQKMMGRGQTAWRI